MSTPPHKRVKKRESLDLWRRRNKRKLGEIIKAMKIPKKVLKFKDFKNEGNYFSYESGEHEVTLEPCLNGFCVGLYRNKILETPKKCTNLAGSLRLPPVVSLLSSPSVSLPRSPSPKLATKKALKFANFFFRQIPSN